MRARAALWPVAPRIVVGEAAKFEAFRTARAALAASGTVTLELALAGVPLVGAYKVGNRRGAAQISDQGPLDPAAEPDPRPTGRSRKNCSANASRRRSPPSLPRSMREAPSAPPRSKALDAARRGDAPRRRRRSERPRGAGCAADDWDAAHRRLTQGAASRFSDRGSGDRLRPAAHFPIDPTNGDSAVGVAAASRRMQRPTGDRAAA